MAETWVVNASPLISLGAIGQLALLTAEDHALIVPAGVALKIAQGPPDDAALFPNGMKAGVNCEH